VKREPRTETPQPTIRLDLWLDIACLFKTRSEAQKACKNGKIDVNGQTAKPHRDIKPGDEIVVVRPLGRRQRVVVQAITDKHLPKGEARALYVDLTPPPSPEEIEARKMAKLTGPFVSRRHAGAPDKRERRELRRLKENI
jgi:ribosome-associated heat shock protein Hsp15